MRSAECGVLSGARGPEAVVGVGGGEARGGRPGAADDEVGVSVDIALVDVHDPWSFEDRFPFTKRQFDPVLARCHLEGEASGVVRCRSLALAAGDVDDSYLAAFDRAGPFRSAHGAADGPVYLWRSWRWIHYGSATSAGGD